ncbi:MAG: WYL domain-containing protein [Lentimicrobium sp.]|nr:WYL domain-containing protein [Lentimicrobium sp.]
MDQPKIERLLRLMQMLTGNRNYTIQEIAVKLNMTTRSIYRYIDTFRAAGFVMKREGNIHRIDKSSKYFKDISSLIHFTEEEAWILKSAIENIDENNLIKQNLKRKLSTVYNYKILAETVVKGKNAQVVNHLVEAIEQKKKVILKKYSSANSKMVSDRFVEPFGFTTNYIQIWAYEPESGKNKLFKLSRISDVEITNHDWECEEHHQAGHIDIFRISSYQLLPVKLKLGLRAARLLMEEYPLSEKDLNMVNDNEWILETDVCSYEGVGRFVMGLLNEIEIIESEDFIDFINKRMDTCKAKEPSFQTDTAEIKTM